MPARFDDIARQADIAHAVRRLGKLAQNAAGCLERLMHVPQWAGAAEAGELQPGRGVAFGDCPRLIDPGEEEWDALGAGALQGREAVPGLLDRGAEAVGQRVEVVAQIARRRQRRLIGQDRRPGEVVRQPDAGDCPRLGAAETGEIEGCLDQPLMGDQRNLVGKLGS
jgi:hypothetical protein